MRRSDNNGLNYCKHCYGFSSKNLKTFLGKSSRLFVYFSLFSPPRGQLARKKQIQIMAEPMGKLKSNSLLFALAFGEEGRAGGVCPVPPRQLPYRWAAAGTSLCPDRESLLSPKSRDSDGFRSFSLFTLIFLQVIRIRAEISDL